MVFIGPGSLFAEWVSPTGYQDPDNKWKNEPLAYDGNPSPPSYAQDKSLIVGNGSFIILTIGTITSNRIRVNADYTTDDINWVDIDVYRNGTWTDVYQGAIANASWDEKTFPLGTVTAARFRYNYKNNKYIYWLYEFQFYNTQPVIQPPTVQTLDASSVEETVAILHGKITDDGGAPCQFQFQYGLTEAYGSETGWEGSKVTGEVFNKVITGLDFGTTYHFGAQACNSAGTRSDTDKTFHTGAGPSGWVTPTGYSNPDSKWEDELNVYDDDTNTYARCYHNINDPVWGPFLYFTRGTITSDRIRFWATTDGYYIDSVDVDVLRNGAWTNVYEGAFSNKQWVEKTFTQGTVTQARIRFHVSTTDVGMFWELHEFDFYKISLNAPTLTWTGEPNYTSDGLDPETGYSSTNFVYRVEYTDADNDGPAWVKVWVDKNGDGDYADSGEELSLYTVTSGDTTKRDGIYTNGEWFTITTNIPYGTNTDNCSYYFGASDGVFNATGTPTTVINAPDVLPTLITLVSPNLGPVGTVVTVSGTGFAGSQTIRLDFGTNKTITTTTSSLTGTFSATFTVDSQPGGTTTITARDQFGDGSYDTDYFIITPTVVSITPNTGVNTGTISVTIKGSGFSSGATATLKKAGQPNRVGTTTVISSGTITTIFNLIEAQVGLWNVVVTNPDGQSGTLTNGFTITFTIEATLSVEKTSEFESPIGYGGSNTYIPGGTITYTITYTNTGNGTATDVMISDVIPKYTYYATGTLRMGTIGSTYDSATPKTDGKDIESNGSADWNVSRPQAVTFELDNVLAGTSGRLYFKVRVD